MAKDSQKEIEEFSILVGRLLRQTINKQNCTIILLALVQIGILAMLAEKLYGNRSISAHRQRCVDIGLFKQVKVKDSGVMRCKYYQMIGKTEQYYTICKRK